MRSWLILIVVISAAAFADEPRPKIGEKLPRLGDEIMVCGQLYHTTTRVVLWTDPGGYDAYRVERRFSPLPEAGWRATQAAGQAPTPREPNRYGTRLKGLSNDEVERVRGGGWDLPLLEKVVDQFVIHFDARGTSKRCFQILHDVRGLSVHFMLDLDGTIYQTLDLKERAQHATIANGRSVGIEVANIGAYPVEIADPLLSWYQPDSAGRIRIIDPDTKQAPGRADPATLLRPIREKPVTGKIQGQQLHQYDFTPEQYEALARLSATLCTLFPNIRCDYPRDPTGALIPQKLPDAELARYQGILGHYHVQTNKVDPGPAFQWDRLIERTKKLMISGQ
jgi:N-acetylmuramoyl-L-alanine amidase